MTRSGDIIIQPRFGPHLMRAVVRAKFSIGFVALAYLLSILVGIATIRAHSGMAMHQRELVFKTADQSDITKAHADGANFQAALLDVEGNMVQGAVPKTIMGLGIVLPFPAIAYQGYIGGVVSNREDGASRFNDAKSAAYYVLTICLQIIGLALTVGGGVNAGVSMFRPQDEYQGPKLLNLVPKEALWDIGRLYILALPFFLAGSLWEFLSPWNIWVK